MYAKPHIFILNGIIKFNFRIHKLNTLKSTLRGEKYGHNKMESAEMYFGIGVTYRGPGYINSYAINHQRTLNRISAKYFVDLSTNFDLPSVGIEIDAPGQNERTKEPFVGKLTVNKREAVIKVKIFLSFASFTENSESEYRNLFTKLIREAVSKVTSHKRATKIGLDPIQFTKCMDCILLEYLSLELPILAEAPKNQIDLRPEYFFLFEDLTAANSFVDRLDLTKFETDWVPEDQDEEEGYYIRVVDIIHQKRNHSAEKLLTKLCEELGGEYDGWASV